MATALPTDKQELRDEDTRHMTNGISVEASGSATKGHYEPCEADDSELGWGVVRLYRDADETPGLYEEPTGLTKHSKHSKKILKKDPQDTNMFKDEECTILCIPAVPSYLTPSDFLGFVGEKTRDDVSHFRMVRTERSNRYMVLMKFRDGKRARQWRHDWNGKAFDGIEPENCHVIFVKSIAFRLPTVSSGQASSFPDMTNDPFTPSVTPLDATPPLHPSATAASAAVSLSSSIAASRTSKPKAPPTPALVELPTCPVCLERMDESTGLLTILCQHVFHCSCLQKWKGSGCPVCRYTHASPFFNKRHQREFSGIAGDEGDGPGPNECSECRSETNLWICLICGNVGCGRYDEAHAFHHYSESKHCFAMELESQRVWDYASDAYVHRIIQDKDDGKFMEMSHPSHHDPIHTRSGESGGREDDFDDYVPREKLDNIGHEYTALLTSQLDSQRMYYEAQVNRAIDKASGAAASAEAASTRSAETAAQLSQLQAAYDVLINNTVPQLERDRDRATLKAERSQQMARTLEKEWRDEKAMNESLMERAKIAREEADRLKVDKAELEEQNRDLGAFISMGEKLKELGTSEEIEEGKVTIGEKKEAVGKRKGKGKK